MSSLISNNPDRVQNKMNWKSPEETHAVMLGLQSVTNTFHIFILLYDTWVIQDTNSTIISIQARKHSAIQVLVGLKVIC